MWVCVSVSVCFFALVACLDSFGDKSYIHGERLAGCILDKGGGGRVQVGGSAEGISWSGQWSQEVLEGPTALSRGGRTFLSPPKGCSSSALGSGKDPPGRRPLSTWPSCVWRKQSSEGNLIQSSSVGAFTEVKAWTYSLRNMVLYDFCLAYLQHEPRV